MVKQLVYAVTQLCRSDDSQLRRILQSLACGKKRVLKKMPIGRDVNDNDDFFYNADFTDPSRKIHINSIQQKISVRVLDSIAVYTDGGIGGGIKSYRR